MTVNTKILSNKKCDKGGSRNAQKSVTYFLNDAIKDPARRILRRLSLKVT